MGNKSVFISLYLFYAFVISIWSFVAIFIGYGNFWFFNGALHTIPLLFLSRLYLFPVARTSGKLPIISMLMVLAFLGSVAIYLFNQEEIKIFLLLPSIGLSGWLLYIFWYSQLPMHNQNQISVGSMLPEVKLRNMNGHGVGNEQFDGDFNVLLFYRGNWCPLCMAQIKELSNSYQTLHKAGAKLFLISPQPSLKSQKLARKYKVALNFLQDPNAKTAKKFRIYHKNGTPLGMELFGYSPDTVLPTVIIVDKNHEIIYIAQTDNYRIRPLPATYLEAIEKWKHANSSPQSSS